MKDLKREIDRMSYTRMLSLWRFEPTGSPWFQGETGEYFKKKFHEKRQEVGTAEHVRVSKSIGW